MDEWYLIRSDDHDMDKDLVITAEVLDAVMDMASVMVTCRISVQDPMKNLELGNNVYVAFLVQIRSASSSQNSTLLAISMQVTPPFLLNI